MPLLCCAAVSWLQRCIFYTPELYSPYSVYYPSFTLHYFLSPACATLQLPRRLHMRFKGHLGTERGARRASVRARRDLLQRIPRKQAVLKLTRGSAGFLAYDGQIRRRQDGGAWARCGPWHSRQPFFVRNAQHAAGVTAFVRDGADGVNTYWIVYLSYIRASGRMGAVLSRCETLYGAAFPHSLSAAGSPL